jgi:disulfide bond formation protein DsbB
MLKLILDRWRLAALLVSAAMLAIAHAFETFGGYAPCTLCLRQREIYWIAAAVALAAMVVVKVAPQRVWRIGSDVLLACIFLAGAGLAAYHAGAEWKVWPGPTTCAGAGGGVSAEAMTGLLQGARIRPPACDHAAWVFAGLSMAGWNAVISTALAGLGAAAALREKSTP